MNNLNITELLKNRQQPIATQFLQTKKVDPIKNMLVKPCKLVAEFDEKGKANIEMWWAMAVIGTTILDTSTKALTRLQVVVLQRCKDINLLLIAMNYFKLFLAPFIYH